MNSTPEVLSENLSVFDDNKNKEIAARNQISYEIAIKFGVPYMDHFGFIFTNRHAFHYRDHVHFTSHNEYILLARVVLYWLVNSKILTETGDLVER